MPSKLFQEFTDRNIGILTRQEQEMLRNMCVAVAGCGGMGGLAAEQLIRLGVGRVKIADFDKFEVHNLSRQTGSTYLNVGVHKAVVLAQYFQAINPELKLEVYTEGVQLENVEEFLRGADVVVDGIDYTQFYHSVVLHREARRRGLCVVNPGAIAMGTAVLVFGPKTRTIEEYVGLSSHAKRDEIESFTVPIDKFCPYMPTYIDQEIAIQAATGQINIPNIIMPQHLGTAISVTEVVMMHLGRLQEPAGLEPRIIVLDLQDRKFEVSG